MDFFFFFSAAQHDEVTRFVHGFLERLPKAFTPLVSNGIIRSLLKALTDEVGEMEYGYLILTCHLLVRLGGWGWGFNIFFFFFFSQWFFSGAGVYYWIFVMILIKYLIFALEHFLAPNKPSFHVLINHLIGSLVSSESSHNLDKVAD